jgi:ribosomal protein S18 acetylase RimI-like enzyme
METNELSVRGLQKSDMYEIYRWRNDPFTIKYSETGRGVVLKEHKEWFEKLIQSNKDLIQIAEINGKPIGIILFIRENESDSFDISINISPEYRKLGLGRRFLNLSEARLIEKVSKCIIRAKVLEENKNSSQFFIKSNYKFLQKINNILIYEKTLV